MVAEKTLVDLVATYNATSALIFIVNVDWDQQGPTLGPGSTDSFSTICSRVPSSTILIRD